MKTRASNTIAEAHTEKKENEEKINVILLGALTALAEKGYANTTIEDIAHASKVSRGLLHYYFETKEDLIVRAVTLGTGTLLSSACKELGTQGPQNISQT